MIAVVLALTAAAPAHPVDGIGAMIEAQAAAWNAGKLGEFVGWYDAGPDTRFYSGGTVTKGRAAVLERYQKAYQADGKEMGQVAFTEVDIRPLGPDHGMARGRWAVTTKAGTVGGLFTLVCRKTPAGWRIVHDHTSKADPEPKKP